MADDWIKMRTYLSRHPRVIMMSEHLLRDDSDLARYVNQNCQRHMSVTSNVTRNAVVGCLVSVWGISRKIGKRENDDLVLKNCDVNVIDQMCDMPGFGEAMIYAGWLVIKKDNAILPNFFDEMNTEVDRRPKTAAERSKE